MAYINGKDDCAADGLTIAQYLSQNEYRKDRVVIELNGEMLPKGLTETTIISPSDKIEILSFVGGG
ncbi:MAG: sulfur carrier protein ThiS [Oscillospiraceae bacterium]|nr:sulfur carrier protein ThiS [Oscillospiraceae bacterium]